MHGTNRWPLRPAFFWMAVLVLVSGCASAPPGGVAPPISAADARATIDQSLPPGVPDRAGWAADLYSTFTTLSIPATRENVCAAVAVIEQESGFRVNPVIPGLGAIAWREIDTRAERAGIPALIVHGALQLKSSTGRSYSDRIDSARTEKDLSDIFEDFIGAVPLGRTLFEGWNPIRTRGPMQVNVAFAERYQQTRPYPYTVKVSVADELFTRRGSLYFGVAHLLAYPAPYDRYLYRFADYNAGQYSSRNAAFQSAVSIAARAHLVRDGALLAQNGTAKGAGSTESALLAIAERLHLDKSEIHTALEQGRSPEFARTSLYERVYSIAEQAEKRPLPRASVPDIELSGPKITRRLTTKWYAHRVDGRFDQCLRR